MTMNVRRALRFGVVLGTTFGTVAALKSNEWDIGTFGIVRFGRTALTAAKIMTDYKMSLFGVENDSLRYKEIKSQVHKRSANQLLDLCYANGGAFIKVGQHLGALDYLLPEEYVNTLKILHHQGPRSSLEDIYHVIKEDLKKEPNEIFATFDPEPIGTASLAQVYKATTKDGVEVAVKVQHRFVKARSVVDLKTMEILVNIAAYAFPEFPLMWLAEETKKNLPLELDFINEGKNADRLRRMFRHYPWFKVPQIDWKLSTTRVLVMEFCEGGPVNSKKYMEDHNIPVTDVTRNLGKLYSDMIFVHGYVHCDPHPGNILVDNSSGSLKIVLLDHGLYMTLTDTFRICYANMWLALLNADVEGIKKYSNQFGVKADHLQKLLASMLTARTWRSVAKGIDKQDVTGTEGHEIKAFVSVNLHLISDILNLVPREMLFMFKTMDLLRTIEFSLKSPPSASSFINMSRCCVRAIWHDRQLRCDSWYDKLLIACAKNWTLFRINLYEIYVWFQMTYLGRWLLVSK
ncbi:putative aarF domain-containing protein kinase 1 [Chamberlinius hualienensis]